MIITAPYRDKNPRLAIVAGIVGGGLLLLLAALFRVQVMQGEHFGNREEAQSLRRIRIPSARGEIVDRNGVVLANNRPSYDIAISLDQLRVSKRQDAVRIAEANLLSLSRVLGLTMTVTDRDFRNHYLKRRPIPMPIWRDQKTETVAAFTERASNVPGTDLIVTPVRQYPHGSLAAHVLGYCGRAEQNEDEELERFFYYEPDSAGIQGVERAFNEYLRGAPGGRTIRVSPGGVKVGDVGEKEAERGDQVVLTIDARIQKIAEDALGRTQLPAGKELRGAVVILDPRNGEVLALVSTPSFDPNIFNPGTSAETVNAVLQNPLSPMLNRALGARYPPGSTFKPVTLLAGLEAGTIALTDAADCHGGLQIGNRWFGCHNKAGHGTTQAMGAMAQSCDVWFYQEGLKTGVESIARIARELGLGEPTGIDFGSERQGLVPSPAWKQEHQGERWWNGDTAQLSIGQSFLLATPLQMANMAATLGNGGTRWRPFIVKRITEAHGAVVEEKQPQVAAHLSAKPGNIEIVRQSLLGVVQHGTGSGASVAGLSVAGKTGTAEFQTRSGRINRAWFIGFAPYEQPTVALAVVIEDGASGSHTAAPVAREILAKVFQKKLDPVAAGSVDAD
jgi:penicillin-binding protein 2